MSSERRPLILVVEDDPSVQSLLGMMLEGEGYEVIAARDGLEGLVKMELQHPSLVILDLMMPNVSGDRVIEEIRADARLAAVPLIVVSGRPDVHETFDGVVGRENVFAKPFEPSGLLRQVDRLLGQHNRFEGGDG